MDQSKVRLDKVLKNDPYAMMIDFNFCCSKLRLDYLMSNDYRVKNQFTVMDHIGVPNHDPQQVSLSLLFYLH